MTPLKTRVAVPIIFDYLGEVAKGFIDFGEQFSAEEFDEAQSHREVIRNHYAEMFGPARCAYSDYPHPGL